MYLSLARALFLNPNPAPDDQTRAGGHPQRLPHPAGAQRQEARNGLSLSHTHTLALSLSHTYIRSLSLTHRHSIFLSLSLTLAFSRSLSFACFLSIPLSLPVHHATPLCVCGCSCGGGQGGGLGVALSLSVCRAHAHTLSRSRALSLFHSIYIFFSPPPPLLGGKCLPGVPHLKPETGNPQPWCRWTQTRSRWSSSCSASAANR